MNAGAIVAAVLLGAHFAFLVVILFGLFLIWKRLTRIESRLQERNAALTRAIASDHRAHVAALREAGPGKAPLSPVRINWSDRH